LKADDAGTGKPIEEVARLSEIWLKEAAKVRPYVSPEAAFKALAEFEKQGKATRAVFVQDRENGIKLLADQAWFVVDSNGRINAFLIESAAAAFAKEKGGEIVDFTKAKALAQASSSLTK
jgi:NitT/TauT family transport system substrate-binding protein